MGFVDHKSSKIMFCKYNASTSKNTTPPPKINKEKKERNEDKGNT